MSSLGDMHEVLGRAPLLGWLTVLLSCRFTQLSKVIKIITVAVQLPWGTAPDTPSSVLIEVILSVRGTFQHLFSFLSPLSTFRL